MSGVRMLHFLKDGWKSIQIHQYYTMALIEEIHDLLINFCFIHYLNMIIVHYFAWIFQVKAQR